VRGKVNNGVGIDINQQELINKMVPEVSKVGEIGHNFYEVADRDWVINPQTISFNKYSFLPKPSKKVVVRTLKFNTAKGAVAENIASNANVQLVRVKFSPTVPTTLVFEGPPITPLDPTMGHV